MEEVKKLMRRINQLMKGRVTKLLSVDDRTNELMVLSLQKFTPEQVVRIYETLEKTESNLKDNKKNMYEQIKLYDNDLVKTKGDLEELKPYYEMFKPKNQVKNETYIG